MVTDPLAVKRPFVGLTVPLASVALSPDRRRIIDTLLMLPPTPAVSRTVTDVIASIWPVSGPQLEGGQAAGAIVAGLAVNCIRAIGLGGVGVVGDLQHATTTVDNKSRPKAGRRDCNSMGGDYKSLNHRPTMDGTLEVYWDLSNPDPTA